MRPPPAAVGDSVTDRTAFAVTWDYRCPFARNAHEHVVAGLRAGAPMGRHFVPFSLGQVHVEEGEPDIWEPLAGRHAACSPCRPARWCATSSPTAFLDVHDALFALRHDHGGHLRDEAALREPCSTTQGVDAEPCSPRSPAATPIAVGAAGARGRRQEHNVWGVPTFIVGDRRCSCASWTAPRATATPPGRTIDRVLDLLGGWPELNEFKHTSIPR